MILDSVKELTEKNNFLGPTTSEIYEGTTGRSSRPPKKELLPDMLRAIGCVEKDGRWVLPPTGNKSQQNNNDQTTTDEAIKIEHSEVDS